MTTDFDVLIIGGGHAGTEAAAAAARCGAVTLLLTHDPQTVGVMSCNPAIGGVGKGHLVREIDALDGVMGRAIDRSGIQFRMLNASKGHAVRGPRSQADRRLYRDAVQDILQEYETLTIQGGAAADFLRDEGGAVIGVLTENGEEIRATAVVLTAGTFLNGVLHCGEAQSHGGRVGAKPSVQLAETLYGMELPMGRLKTGTPPRLDGTTIDWSLCEEQQADATPTPFSFLTDKIRVPQIACHITYTTAETHNVIRENVHRSPIFSGQITSSGPRYCPSIEDKIVRFADKERHQIFLEPEGLGDDTVYPNGISTSLPQEVQEEILRSIPALKDAKITQYGYAVEYDYVDPRALRPTLEVKSVPNLFFAGQINGTTGYEEAGAQGLIAGVNAALKTRGSAETFTIGRDEGYIGVLIDDLTTRGVTEPYRMFTSRAEYRLRLRADNADQRLTPKGIAVGCVGAARREAWQVKAEKLEAARHFVRENAMTPNELAKLGIAVKRDGKRRSIHDLLAYPNIDLADLVKIWPELASLSPDVAEQVQIDARYAAYMTRQDNDIRTFQRDEALELPNDLNYDAIGSLSNEVRSKLTAARPTTLGAASRIQGITPAALTALFRYVKTKQAA